MSTTLRSKLNKYFSCQNQFFKKINFYHDHDIVVSTGSAIAEYALMDSLEGSAKEARTIGFDVVEIGENTTDLSPDRKQKIVDIISSNGLGILWKIGRKDPQHQLDANITLAKTSEVLEIDAKKVILEANEGYSVGIYD